MNSSFDWRAERLLVAAAVALLGCGRANHDSDGHSPLSGGSGGSGGDTANAGTLASGGSPASQPGSCKAAAADPAEFCAGTRCPVTSVDEIECENAVSEFSLALDGERALFGFSAMREAPRAPEFEIAERSAAGFALTPVIDISFGQVLVASSGTALLGWVNEEPHWLDMSGSVGARIAPVVRRDVLDVALDDAGRAVFLLLQPVVMGNSLTVLTQDGRDLTVAQGSISSATLVDAEPSVVYVDTPPTSAARARSRVFRWSESGGSEFLAEFFASAVPGTLRAARDGAVATLDLLSNMGYQSASRTGGMTGEPLVNQLLLLEAGGSQRSIWERSGADFECSGFRTVEAPDICPQVATAQSDADSSRLGLHSLASTSDSNLWLARVSGSAEHSCTWEVTHGCFESFPCECTQRLGSRHALSLFLYRSPDFMSPVFEAAIPGLADDAGLLMKSIGTRLSIVISTRDRVKSKLRWFDLETALVP